MCWFAVAYNSARPPHRRFSTAWRSLAWRCCCPAYSSSTRLVCAAHRWPHATRQNMKPVEHGISGGTRVALFYLRAIWVLQCQLPCAAALLSPVAPLCVSRRSLPHCTADGRHRRGGAGPTGISHRAHAAHPSAVQRGRWVGAAVTCPAQDLLRQHKKRRASWPACRSSASCSSRSSYSSYCEGFTLFLCAAESRVAPAARLVGAGAESASALSEFTPSFLWLLRDFYFDLDQDGVRVSCSQRCLYRLGGC